MLRRFNYTGRARLLGEDVHFSLREEAGGWSFDAWLALEEYDLPAEALVSVEAYRQTTWMRFDFGTVGALRPPAERRLSEFDSPEDILFRVRVTSPGTPEEPHGLLLAEADRVRLRAPEEEEESRITLLPVKPAELGAQLWRVDFQDHPRLEINTAAGTFKQIGLDPGFVAVAYPAILREVLGRILHREKHRELDDADDWKSQWLRFAAQGLGVGDPPAEGDGEDADDDWIEAAAAAFSQRHDVLGSFRKFWEEEGGR